MTLDDGGEGTIVATASGRLQGRREGGIGTWFGIPYAAPPTGALRFRAPQPVAPWAGLRDAAAFGASAPQPDSLPERVLGLDGHQPASEDCLTLNVWSRGPGGPARPVMVWLHGGSFLTGAGSDSLYDGQRLAGRGDVVVVTLNYRLGALGFLHLSVLGEGEVDENLGLRDQIAALAWVRDTIAAFGGDPARVTLFGQSAGAMAIGALLGAPAARGLFHRAVLQSGAARNVHTRSTADRQARRYRGALGRPRSGSAPPLRGLPVERLIAAGQSLPGAIGLPFQPLVDGAVLPGDPLAAVRAGSAAGVPLLLGTTRDELALYGVVAARDPAPQLLKKWRRLRAVIELAGAFGPRRLLRLRRAYGPGADGLADFLTDAVFRIPAIALAEAQGAHAPVFFYRFDWRSPAYGGALRACHALDVPFVWTALHKPAASTLARDEPAARALAEAIQDAWIAFARTGDPNTAALPPWPRYEPPRRATMVLDQEQRVEDDPQAKQRRAWARGRRGVQ